MLEKTYCFDDVLLKPAYSQIRTRRDVDISVHLSPELKLDIPIIASPMDTVSGAKMAIRLNELGGIAILHRYCTIEEQVKMVDKVVAAGRKVGAAVGAVGDYLERAQRLVDAGVSLLCVDVANGDHILVEEALYHLKRVVSNDIHIMTGNVATMAGFSHNASHGASSVRCGVGGGCFVAGTEITTKNGKKRIEEVLEGEEVLTHMGRYRKVVNMWHFDKNEDLYRVNGIGATRCHEFYVVHREDRDKVNEQNLSDYAVWVSAEELDKEKHLLVKVKFELIEIEEIEKESFEGRVFDLEVEEDHSFVANDVVVHNSMCTTRIQTGHGIPTLQTIMWASKAKRGGTKIVADGGIKTAGDIVKSLAAGADVVMLGSLLAGTDEAPGEVLNLNGRLYKRFRGMASKEAQTDWRGVANSVEGVTSYSPYKGSVESVIEELVEGIRSGLSYSGAKNIKELQEKARFCQISSAGMAESKPHGLR